MAYCRFSDSDIYLVKTPRSDVNEWECFSCKLSPNEERQVFYSPFEVLMHLNAHEDAGHKINPNAFFRIYKDIDEELQNNPSRRNIELALKLYFSKEYCPKFDFLFLPENCDLQECFLTKLEELEFCMIWKEAVHFFAIIDDMERFDDKIRFLHILEKWEKELIALMVDQGIQPVEGMNPLSDEERSMQRLFSALGKEPNLQDILNDIRKDIADLQKLIRDE